MSQSNKTAFLVMGMQSPYLRPSDNGMDYLDIGAPQLIADIENTAQQVGHAMTVIYLFAEPIYSFRTGPHFLSPCHYRPHKHSANQRSHYDIPDNLSVPPDVHVVTATESSAFQDPNNLLHSLLQELSIDRLVIGGVYTDISVLRTATDAVLLGYNANIAVDLCRDTATGADSIARESRLFKQIAHTKMDIGVINLCAGAPDVVRRPGAHPPAPV